MRRLRIEDAKTMSVSDFEWRVLEDLRDTFENEMAKGMEIVPLKSFVSEVWGTEKRFGVELSPNAVLKCYWEACDNQVDSWIQNEYDTPESDHCPGCSTRDEAIARWEAMRPSNRRCKELQKKFEDV